MFTIYVYVLDTLADWELGYVTAELHSRRFFKKGAPNISLKTVSCSKKPIQTMGGLTVVPDCLIEEIAVSGTSVLLLPGANTWNDPEAWCHHRKGRRASFRRRCGVRDLWGYCRVCWCRAVGWPPAHQQRAGISRNGFSRL